MELEEQKKKLVVEAGAGESEEPSAPTQGPDESLQLASDTATGFDFSVAGQRKPRRRVDYSGKLFCGRYQIQALLGEGGMGAVYMAVHTGLNKAVAIKILHSSLADDDGASRRFEREAKATSGLSHANLAAVSDFGVSEDGSPYFVMEYVQGNSLASVIDKVGSIEPSRVIDLFCQVAGAVNYAHSHGVIHRDLKPSNIIVSSAEDGSDLIKVVDFGIAKVLGEQLDIKQNLTQTGEILGSPLYMSPEQCTGIAMDRRSDIYSIGCVMYEALTGKPPLAGDNTVQTILKHVNEKPAPMASVNPSMRLPAGLEEVVLQCLEKNPEARYQSLEALSQDLSAIKEGRAPVRLAGTAADTTKIGGHATRLRGRKAVAVLLCLVSVAAYFTLTRSGMDHPTASVNPSAEQAEPNRAESYEGRNLSQWTDAIEAAPTNPDNYFGRGVLHDMRDERTNAIEDYNKAIEFNSKFYEAYKRRSFVYAMLAQYDQALADANFIINHQPQDSDSYVTRSFVEEAQGNSPAAIKDLRTAIDIAQKKLQVADNGNDVEMVRWLNQQIAYMNYCLSRAFLSMGKTADSLEAISRSIKMDGESGAYGQRSLVYSVMGHYQEALADGKKATETHGTRGVEWYYLAYAYLGLGRTADADAAVEKGFAMETFPARGYRFKGEYYRAAGLLDKAIQTYSASTSLEAYAPGYRGRARAYIALGKFHSAEEDLLKADKLVGGNLVTLSFLARTEEENGRSTQADAHITQAMPTSHDRVPPIVYVNKGAIDLHRGKLDNALSVVNAALALDPYLKEAYEMRAAVYDQKKQSREAAADREKAKHLLSQIEF
jgi:tetratricopeptide (TPR) repeat protein/tRNA A-37 threonylcarbamoyl transferase component Bud32